MRASKSNRGAIIKPHLCVENNRKHAATASRVSRTVLIKFQADPLSGLSRSAFDVGHVWHA
jgi:hypothetical protein